MIVATISMSQAAEPIGRIVKMRGNVEVFNKTSGDTYTLKNGDGIFEGDLMKSSKGSFAKILMKDDTIFQLGPNTEMIFEKFKFKSKKSRTATYNLVKGQLRSLFTVKSKDKSLTIKTPNTAMGIRGTEILSDVYKFKGKVKTDIALLSGKLEVDISKMKFGEALKNKVINLKPGQVFESDHFRKNFTGGKEVRKLIKRLPSKVFKSLKKSEKKGGKVFLLEARRNFRRDLFNGARFNFNRDGSNKEDVKPNKDDLSNSSKRKGPPNSVDLPSQSNGRANDNIGRGVKDNRGNNGNSGDNRADVKRGGGLPSGVRPPVVIRNNDFPGQKDEKRNSVGVSRDELDKDLSPKKRRKLEEKRRKKERKEQERGMRKKRMEERKKQARMRREEMIRRRQEQLARMRQEEIKKIIFGRFENWRGNLTNAMRVQLRNTYGDITPEVFCKVKPAACSF